MSRADHLSFRASIEEYQRQAEALATGRSAR